MPFRHPLWCPDRVRVTSGRRRLAVHARPAPTRVGQDGRGSSRLPLVSPPFGANTNKGDDIMKLLTADIRAKLIANGRKNTERLADPDNEDGATHDFRPVVKLFNPCGAGTWLLTELDPDEPDLGFGLCDLGMGCPELGTVLISELESVRLMGGALGIERDRHWTADKPLSAYADEARELGYIKA